MAEREPSQKLWLKENFNLTSMKRVMGVIGSRSGEGITTGASCRWSNALVSIATGHEPALHQCNVLYYRNHVTTFRTNWSIRRAHEWREKMIVGTAKRETVGFFNPQVHKCSFWTLSLLHNLHLLLVSIRNRLSQRNLVCWKKPFGQNQLLTLKMPLLNKKPFTPDSIPSDLRPDEEVFVCQATKEVFRDYE